MNKLLCIVGLTGSGKTTVADYIKEKGFFFIRFGQITLDEVRKQGLAPTEENERPIREGFRKQYGMAAFAILNYPKIDAGLEKGNVVCDGLYSWQEYVEMKKKYGESMITIAAVASPKTRYARLASRIHDKDKDTEIRFRQASAEQAKSRDYAEIENIQKAGPIAMADYTIVNECSVQELYAEIEGIMKKIM
ncbi:MAG: AAA family ATPase [Nanoarchaeota archaeon]